MSMWQTEYNTAVIKGRVRPKHLSDKNIKVENVYVNSHK